LGILREREYGIQGVPEIAAGFQSLLKQGGVSVPRYSHKYSRLAYSEMLYSGRMSERISVSIELEFFNKYLFNALKRSLSNATPKRKLDIIYYYSRDPRVKFSIALNGFSSGGVAAHPQWSTVFNNVQNMRQYLR